MAAPLFTVECPCCKAKLTLDPELRAIIAHEPPPPTRSVDDLGADGVGQLLDLGVLIMMRQDDGSAAVFELLDFLGDGLNGKHGERLPLL
jgi:hypothetical protein